MKPNVSLSRRLFLAASSTLLVARRAPGQSTARAANNDQLALSGGPKAVAQAAPRPVRWGQTELERLRAMLQQSTLFYWRGPQTELLKQRFREVCPNKHVMTCSSGTAAIHIAVAAAGIEPGDEVITSPITDMGTVIGVLYQQAVPVFADLKPHTYNLDPDDVERKITPKTRAIIAVHLAGNPCDMKALKAIADKHKLTLIEDAAQAWGARYGDHPIGTIGHVGCFSLQNSKHVTCGDGGVVASSHPDYGPLLQPFGDKGFDRIDGGGLFHHFATNYRMSEPQAAVAAAQLTRLEEIASTRARLGNLLTSRIAEVRGVAPHEVRDEDRCTYWFYMLRVRPDQLRCSRDEFAKALKAEGVPAAAGYIPVPLYGNPVFQQHNFFAGRWPVKEHGLTDMDYRKTACPEAESILKSSIRISLHEAMSDEYVSSLGDAIAKVARHYVA